MIMRHLTAQIHERACFIVTSDAARWEISTERMSLVGVVFVLVFKAALICIFILIMENMCIM